MEISIVPFRTYNKEYTAIANAIRNTVFVIGQNVDPEIEYDEFEDDSQHYLAFLNDKAVGTARWRHVGEKIKLERFAVLEEARGKGIGQALLKSVMDDVLPFKKELYLHSQLEAMSLYERAGFKKVGEMFLEAEIKHYKMVLRP